MLHSLFFVERIFRTIKTVTTHRSVSPLLSTVLPRPAPQLSVPGAALNVDAVDDVEELLHDGHLLEHELNLPVNCLETFCYQIGTLDLDSNELTKTDRTLPDKRKHLFHWKDLLVLAFEKWWHYCRVRINFKPWKRREILKC